jgi:HemY protein
LVARTPTRRVCVMMAQIEDSEHGDRGRVREWLARAVHAPRDPAWVADGRISDTWAAVSPVTGTLDGYAWMVPEDESDPAAAHVLEALGAIEPESPIIDVSTDADRLPDPSPEIVGPDGSSSETVSTKAESSTNDPVADDSSDGKVERGSVSGVAAIETVGDAVDERPARDEDVALGAEEPPSSEVEAENRAHKAKSAGLTPAASSKGHRRAVEAGAVRSEGKETVGDAKQEKESAARTSRGSDNKPTNGRRVGPESVAGVAVAAQEGVDDIETRVLPSQPDDPGPLDDHDGSEADRKKWAGLFN